MNEYPKMLFGPEGWGNLDDNILVSNEDEESVARADGYAPLGAVQETTENPDAVPVKRGRPRKV